MATLWVVVAALILPYTPLDQALGLSQLPVSSIPAVTAVVIVYVFAAELAKRVIYGLARLP